MTRTAFFAYPSAPGSIGDSANAAAELARSDQRLSLTPWPTMNVQGIQIARLIRENIDTADFLAADITYPNFNVYYEAGYAIGRGKPIIPTVNVSIEHARNSVSLTGIFDTVGQAEYQNSHELLNGLLTADLRSMRDAYIRPKDHSQPLFMLDTDAKTDFRNYIVHSIANSQVSARMFDPFETPRLSMAAAISEISASAGVILPLISEETRDHLRHNLRAAFLAGLAHSLDVEPLIIQYDNLPAPIDFRDDINTVRSKREVDQQVSEYCGSTLIKNQRSTRPKREERSLLEQIDIGTSAAERETPKLDFYFVRTAEFARALRSDGSIVIGRKGSGKTAIFYQVTAEKVGDPRNLVLELSPASHNLSEMRVSLLGVLNAGVFDHTIAAFWQYILYFEILIKLREALMPKAKYKMGMLAQIEAVEKRFRLTDEMVASDFTSRLEIAVNTIIEIMGESSSERELRPKLTNMLFEREIPALRDAVASLASGYTGINILFDNIDKGWPARKVESYDVRMVRHLIDVFNKMQRELSRKDINLNYLLFLRSDVYERLVEETSDRGQYNVIKVDWSDEHQLIHLMKERVQHNFTGQTASIAWDMVNPRMPDGSTAIEHMVESSLMRPRFLIDLCEKAISFAINRGHDQVLIADVEAAIEQHAAYLVSDFAFEVRDVSGVSENIFYAFIGLGDEFDAESIHRIVDPYKGTMTPDDTLNLLLWYGFLGLINPDGKTSYIYNRAYDIRRLEAERNRQGTTQKYRINPAFLKGL